MTETDIQFHLMAHLKFKGGCAFNNFTPSLWWECDVIHITDSGYFREYEIKLSRSDFKADSKKARNWYENNNRVSKTKHQLLSESSPTGPKQFYFVCPDDLIQASEVPEWAGLIWIHENKFGRVHPVEQKKAPILNKEKTGEALLKRIYKNAYYRYVDSFMRANAKRLQAEREKKEH